VEKNGNDTRSLLISERRSSGKTDTRRSKSLFFLALLSIVLSISQPIDSESLWTPEFDGYLSHSSSFEIGDIVRILIDSDSSLSYSASNRDAKTLTVEFAGGEFGSLLSFLPTITTRSDQNVEGEETLELRSELVARVTEIDPNGQLFIQGSRSLSFEGKEESITVSGWVNPGDLSGERSVDFSRIADSQLVFRSLLQPTDEILTEADIEEALADLTRSESGAAAAPSGSATTVASEEASTATEVASGAPQADGGVSYRLTDEKKRELFLRYVNRLLDLIFR
jgi:flagellar basal body L-ring protein FlgH